jgi:hypothetical protein
MHRVLDRTRSKSVSRYRRPRFCLPTISTAWAPRSSHRSRDGVSISRLNTWPTPTPVNASPAPLQTPTHDSEPVRVASPSPYETFIHNTLPVFTGAPKSETNPKSNPNFKNSVSNWTLFDPSWYRRQVALEFHWARRQYPKGHSGYQKRHPPQLFGYSVPPKSSFKFNVMTFAFLGLH